MSYYKYPPQPVATLSGAGLATESKQDDIISALGGNLSVVDKMDTFSPLDASVNTIPKFSSNPLEIIASTAAAISRIQADNEVGEFMELYTGAAAAEVFLCKIPHTGSNELVNVNIPIGTRLSIRATKDTDIVLGEIDFNFIG